MREELDKIIEGFRPGFQADGMDVSVGRIVEVKILIRPDSSRNAARTGVQRSANIPLMPTGFSLARPRQPFPDPPREVRALVGGLSRRVDQGAALELLEGQAPVSQSYCA